ncbi:MAG: hypothetical protein KAG56_00890 [Sulfurovaceae bacterium]|nr:hypothetical protein [Sulfurovaceae bacterium]
MDYLLMEILVYIAIGGLIGFVIGWLYRGECKSKKSEAVEKKEEISKTVEPKEIKIDKPKNSSKPNLLTQAREEGKDNLSLIKGIGKVLEARLNDLGIYHFDQMVSWSSEEKAWIGINISFPGKVEREEWSRQAKELVASSNE